MKISEIIAESEVLDEFSYTDHQIKRILQKKGYKFLGAGVDQSAYIEPSTGYVLKIFGSQEGSKGFSPDHKMFFKWAKFCMKHQDNPFLPRFYGYESFKFDGDMYLQIRTEQLFTDKKLQSAVSELGAQTQFPSWEGRFTKQDEKVVLAAVKTPERMKLLKWTLNKLYRKGEKNNYAWDLHSGNIMVRKDGTPVINDPWVLTD